MEGGKLEKHLRDVTEVQEHCLKLVNCVQAWLGQPALVLPGSPQSFPGLDCVGEGGRCVGVPLMPGWMAAECKCCLPLRLSGQWRSSAGSSVP